MILSASTKASDLTSKLLTFARKSKPDVIVNIHNVLGDVIELLKHTIDKNIKISCELNTSDYVIMGDSAQFQSTVMNLALNSRDAMPDGGQIVIKTENVDLDKSFQNHTPMLSHQGTMLLFL